MLGATLKPHGVATAARLKALSVGSFLQNLMFSQLVNTRLSLFCGTRMCSQQSANKAVKQPTDYHMLGNVTTTA
jgi:hypothetical protein